MYVINELKNSVTGFDFDAKSGILLERKTISTLPEGFEGTSYCADLKITPDGRYLYGTNRGHDSIASYQIQEDGTLRRLHITPSQGKSPQNLAITANGKWLLCANMGNGNVAVFQIEPDGKLTAAGSPVKHTSPSCIMILPTPGNH